MKAPNIKRIGIHDVNFGKNITIVQPVNLYGCNIGDNTFIGPFVEIQRDVIIGHSCKIQSHAFICEKVTVGNNCFISHGVMFINDTFKSGKPADGDKKEWKKTIIGNDVSIGTNSTILPVSICSNVTIGAGSVVTKNIDQAGIYAGNPATIINKSN